MIQFYKCFAKKVETIWFPPGIPSHSLTPKEIQIILKLFLVRHLLQQTKSVPSQPASNVGALVIHRTGLNWLDSI